MTLEEESLSRYLGALRQELEALGLDPLEISLQVTLENDLVHTGSSLQACRDLPNPNTFHSIEELENLNGCTRCTWKEVGLTHQALYWPSEAKLYRGRRATLHLAKVVDTPLEELQDCFELAGALTGVPRGEELYRIAADRIAEAITGRLDTAYRAHLAQQSFHSLLDEAERLELQGLPGAARAVRAAQQQALEEVARPGWVLLYLTHGWELEDLLALAARRWQVRGNLYLAPREAYARRRTGNGKVREAVILDVRPSDTELETVGVLYDPKATGSATLAATLQAARAL